MVRLEGFEPPTLGSVDRPSEKQLGQFGFISSTLRRETCTQIRGRQEA